MIARAHLGSVPRRRVGRQAQVWNPVNGRWEASNGGLGQAVGSQAWCDTASAWNPVAWFACFGSDVAKVNQALMIAPAPPGAAAPGAPCQNASDPGCLSQLTVAGAFTPDMSASEAAANSLASWQDFFGSISSPDSGPTNDTMTTFFVIAGAVVALYFLIPSGRKKR
jgi:hypothetical protein